MQPDNKKGGSLRTAFFMHTGRVQSAEIEKAYAFFIEIAKQAKIAAFPVHVALRRIGKGPNFALHFVPQDMSHVALHNPESPQR